jgi:hypothetical protein
MEEDNDDDDLKDADEGADLAKDAAVPNKKPRRSEAATSSYSQANGILGS